MTGTGACGCERACGDDGDVDGPGVCKGLPLPKPAPLVEIVLVRREQVARSAETAETRGWRATLDFCFVADGQDDARLMLDTVTDWIERCGGFVQGGSTEAMADADVVPGSPLAMALAVERASDGSIVGAHPSPGAVLVGDRQGQAWPTTPEESGCGCGAREVCLCGHEADLHDGECEGSRLAAPGSEQPCDCGNFRPAWAAWQERADVAERALVARDAELAEARRERATAIAARNHLSERESVERDRRKRAEAEVTQLRAERDDWKARRDELYAWQTDAVQQLLKRGDLLAAAERLAHDRGDVLERIAANAEAWHGPNNAGSGHAKALAVIASWAREALAGVVPPEQET